MPDKDRNEGEGNKTAARRFNQQQRDFVAKADIDSKARAAEKALKGPERAELKKAEAEGRRPAKP